MQKILIVVAVIYLLNSFAYADLECDTKYNNTLTKIKSLTNADISDETRSKWILQLEKAYKLCKDGKKEQAAEIMVELRKEKEADTVFSTFEGN